MTGRAVLATGACLAIALSIAGLTYRHGGTQSVIVYVASLPLLVGIALALWLDRDSDGRDGRAGSWLRFGVLACLLAAAGLPSLRAYGFLHLGLGLGTLLAVRALVMGRRASAPYWLGGLAALGAAEVFFAMLQSVGWLERFHPTGVVSGTFMNPNHFGGFLGLAAPLGAGLLVSKSRRVPKSVQALGWALIVLGGAYVVLSRSAGGLLSYVGGLSVFAALIWAGREERSRRFKTWLAIVFVFVTALALGPLVAIELGEAGGRAMLYGDVLRMISDHWLTGIGPGLFRWRYLEYQSGNFDDRYDFAHNDFLQHLAELGVVLGGLLWCFLIWRLFRVLRSSLDRRAGNRVLLCGAGGGLVAVHLHASFDFDLHISATWLSLCAVHGVFWALEPRTPAELAEKLQGPSWRLLCRYALVGATLACLGTTTLRLASALEVERATGLEGKARESALRRSMMLDPTNPLVLDTFASAGPGRRCPGG